MPLNIICKIIKKNSFKSSKDIHSISNLSRATWCQGVTDARPRLLMFLRLHYTHHINPGIAAQHIWSSLSAQVSAWRKAPRVAS